MRKNLIAFKKFVMDIKRKPCIVVKRLEKLDGLSVCENVSNSETLYVFTHASRSHALLFLSRCKKRKAQQSLSQSRYCRVPSRSELNDGASPLVLSSHSYLYIDECVHL
jgi:hypothetical protein